MPFVSDGFAKQDPSGDLTASDIPSGIDAAKIHDGSVSNTEFGYLDGVAGPLNPQLIPYAGGAGGSANNLTVTVPGHTETAGAAFRFRATNANTGVVTIAVNGGIARGLRVRTQAGVVSGISSGQIHNGGMYTAIWDAANNVYQLAESFKLAAADIPATLNATTFGGAIGMSGTHTAPTGSDAGIWRDSSSGVNFNGLYGQFFAASGLAGGWNNSIFYTTKAFQFFGVTGLVNNDQSTKLLTICSGPTGSQAATASINVYGNSHPTKPGDAEYYTGSASGAAHSFFDKNGAEQLTVNEYGPVHGQSHGFFGVNGHGGLQNYLSNSYSINIYGGLASGGFAGSAGSSYRGSNDASYPGAHQQFAPLSTRAASTAIALCPVATGDTAKVEVSETTIDDCLAFVNAAGSVALYDKIGGTVNANIVNSSSPAAGEYGVYISAGVLYFKGGSSYAGKMGSFSKVWKA